MTTTPAHRDFDRWCSSCGSGFLVLTDFGWECRVCGATTDPESEGQR